MMELIAFIAGALTFALGCFTQAFLLHCSDQGKNPWQIVSVKHKIRPAKRDEDIE